MLPSPADIQYFMEVALTGNLTRASERLGISQPSLSVAIQRLEQAVGATLLLRSKKGVALTQAGRQLLAHARELTQRWDGIRRQALASMNEIQGSYTIGCHPSVGMYSLPNFLPGLLEKHPSLEVRLTHDLSRKILERVVALEVDVGIVVNPIQHPDLVIRKLCDDEISLWVGKGNRRIQDPRSGEAVLLCEPDLVQTQAIMKKLQKAGFSYRRTLASNNLELLTEMAAAGAGVAVLPGRVAGLAAQKGLRRIPKAPVFPDVISLIYRMENKGIRSVQAIAEEVAAVFRRESAS